MKKNIIKLLKQHLITITILNTIIPSTSIHTAAHDVDEEIQKIVEDAQYSACAGLFIDHARDKIIAPLIQAIKNNNIDRVQPLSENNFLKKLINHQTSDGYTALTLAATSGNPAIIQLLLDANASIEKINPWGYTPLVQAAKNNHIDAVKILLNGKALIDHICEQGHTALTVAAQEGYADMINNLLTARASVNQENNHHKTALMYAAEKNHIPCIQTLLNAHALVDFQSEEIGENTAALMLASQAGNNDAVNLLLQANASVDLKNNMNFTALTYALRCEQYAIASTLIKAGANVESPFRIKRKHYIICDIEMTPEQKALIMEAIHQVRTPSRYKVVYEQLGIAVLARLVIDYDLLSPAT